MHTIKLWFKYKEVDTDASVIFILLITLYSSYSWFVQSIAFNYITSLTKSQFMFSKLLTFNSYMAYEKICLSDRH